MSVPAAFTALKIGMPEMLVPIRFGLRVGRLIALEPLTGFAGRLKVKFWPCTSPLGSA